MYYGNAAAATTSNIHTTFIWADDFQDAAWTNNNTHMVNYAGAVQSIQNGILQQQGAAKSEPILEIFENGALKNFPDNYVAEVSVKPNIKAGNAIICPRYTIVADKYESFMDMFWSNAALNKVVANIWSQLTPPVKLNDPINAGSWYKLSTVVSKQGDTNRLIVMIDDTVYIDQTDASLTNPGLALITFDPNRDFDVSYDNFWVRAYAATEPVSAMGQEQDVSPVATGTATNITSTGATLSGSLMAGAVTSTKVSFEYGTTTAYGSKLVIVTPTSTPANISGELTGLQPNTLYHFRATSVSGVTAVGNDATFTTLPASVAKSSNVYIWVIVGVAVLAILIVVIVAGTRKKKAL